MAVPVLEVVKRIANQERVIHNIGRIDQRIEWQWKLDPLKLAKFLAQVFPDGVELPPLEEPPINMAE